MIATTKTCCLHHEHERVDMRVYALVLICVLGIFSIPASARPQDANGGRPITPDSQVSGKVTAVHGKAAPGAIVTLQNTQTGLKMTTKTDKHGKYLLQKSSREIIPCQPASRTENLKHRPFRSIIETRFRK